MRLSRTLTVAAVLVLAQMSAFAGQIANLLTDANNTVGSKSGSFTTIYGLMQSDPSKKGVVGLLTDLRSGSIRGTGEGHGLNLFVEGCVEAVGEICTTIDEVLAVLERWRRPG